MQRLPAVRVPCVDVRPGLDQNVDHSRVGAPTCRHMEHCHAAVVPRVHVRAGFEALRDLLGGDMVEEVPGAPVPAFRLADGGRRAEKKEGGGGE